MMGLDRWNFKKTTNCNETHKKCKSWQHYTLQAELWESLFFPLLVFHGENIHGNR